MYRGGKINSDAAPIVYEYMQKQHLRKLGYNFDSKDLSVFKADCFTIIAGEISKLEKEEMEKVKRRGK